MAKDECPGYQFKLVVATMIRPISNGRFFGNGESSATPVVSAGDEFDMVLRKHELP